MFTVAIVGRPNVGKSTLFNRLTRSRKAIVGNQPGITRDRLSETVNWDGKSFRVIDTGGVVPGEKEELPESVFRQAEIALEESDLVLMVVDGREGPTPVDESLHDLLRSGGKEFLLVVNKMDVPSVDDHAYAFHSLGIEEFFPVSAEHSRGFDELLEAILERVPEGEPEESDGEIRVAIIGRPNMGKSSLLNQLLGQERVIVSETPGTTRDSVDSVLETAGQRYRLVDTAGIRRKGKTSGMVEKLSMVMARRSIQRCDVVLLLIDATEGATRADATIGGYAHEAGKSLLLVVNKWDLIERDAFTAIRLEKEYRMKLKFLDYAPLVFVSARTGQRVFKLLEHVQRAYQARRLRVPTAELNQFLQREVQPRLQAASPRRKFPVVYGSQVAVDPPTFVLFTRSRQKMHFSVERFLVNRLRERYGFYATPLVVRQRLRAPRKR